MARFTACKLMTGAPPPADSVCRYARVFGCLCFEGVNIPTEIDYGPFNSPFPDYPGQFISCPALGDGPEIEPHARLFQKYGARCFVNADFFPVNEGAGVVYGARFGERRMISSDIPEFYERPDGRIEQTAGFFGEGEGRQRTVSVSGSAGTARLPAAAFIRAMVLSSRLALMCRSISGGVPPGANSARRFPLQKG